MGKKVKVKVRCRDCAHAEIIGDQARCPGRKTTWQDPDLLRWCRNYRSKLQTFFELPKLTAY